MLPASARLALWGTLFVGGAVSGEDAVRRAHPAVDHVDGDVVDRLATWRDLGEQVLLVALPRPGDLTGMPKASLLAQGAACDEGECVYVPGLGGLLVPTQSPFGSPGDEGTRVDWTPYDAQPVPRHVLESLSLADLDRQLAQATASASGALEAVDGRPWSTRHRAEADAALVARPWNLPPQTPQRALRVMVSAARVAVIVEEGLSLAAAGPALDVHSSGHREQQLRVLLGTSRSVLASAVNVAAMTFAGWR